MISLTIGANDLRFDRPHEFFDGDRFFAHVADERVAKLRSEWWCC
ncbi:MAG: hypothetical protein ACKVHU_06355 [Acidimicrobiales bacterium]